MLQRLAQIGVFLIQDFTFIAFDTETTGRYPLESEICEIAAVKFINGEIADTFTSLIKPNSPMSEEVIKIHGITNEMVVDAPQAESVIRKFHQFIGQDYLVAHHSPFDLGFISVDFEKLGLSFPQTPVMCSSLLSRQVIKDSVNHKLQTLIPHLGLTQGSAHRATDDARACGELLLKCIEVGKIHSLDMLWSLQGGKLYWSDFSIDTLRNNSQSLNILVACIESKVPALLKYGSASSAERLIDPIGLVRNPDGDYLVASDGQGISKRFYLSKVIDVRRASH